jgi:hypothetical protein
VTAWNWRTISWPSITYFPSRCFHSAVHTWFAPQAASELHSLTVHTTAICMTLPVIFVGVTADVAHSRRAFRIKLLQPRVRTVERPVKGLHERLPQPDFVLQNVHIRIELAGGDASNEERNGSEQVAVSHATVHPASHAQGSAVVDGSHAQKDFDRACGAACEMGAT